MQNSLFQYLGSAIITVIVEGNKGPPEFMAPLEIQELVSGSSGSYTLP